MKSRGYRLTVTEEEDGSWTIHAPDLPGMVAAGATLAAAARNLPDAIDSWIEGARAAGMDVPHPSKSDEEYSGRFVLRIAKSLHRKLAERALLEGVSLNAYCATVLASGLEPAQVVAERSTRAHLPSDVFREFAKEQYPQRTLFVSRASHTAQWIAESGGAVYLSTKWHEGHDEPTEAEPAEEGAWKYAVPR